MKTTLFPAFCLATLLVSAGLLMGGRQPGQSSSAASAEPKATGHPVASVSRSLILFKPREVGAPSLRVGKATRGNQPDLTLCAITPESSCLTLSATPVLYWHQSDASSGNLKIVVNDPQNFQTLCTKTIREPLAKGIHGFDLGDAGVRLAPDREYEWTVTFEVDSRNPSANATAVGRLAVMKPEPSLKEALEKASGSIERARVLAANGIWYDAFHEISLGIRAEPDRADLIALRDSLINQAGLKSVIP